MTNYKINSISKSFKKQKHENSSKRKWLREYITSQLEDHNFVQLFTNFEKHLLRQAIISIEMLKRERKKNPEKVQDWVFKLINTYNY